MSTQRIAGIAIAVALVSLGAWQASSGNWTATVIAGLGSLGSFLPAAHKGES